MLVSFEGYSVLFRAFHTSYTKAVDQRKCMQRPCCVEKSFDWEWNWMELGKSDPKLDSTCRHCRVWSHWQFHSPRSRCMHQSSRSLLSYSAFIFIASSPCHHVISYRPWEPRGCFLNLPSKTPLSRLGISGKLCQHHRCPHHGPQQGCTTACDAQGPRTFTGGLLHPFKPKRWNIRIWWFVLWPNHWGYRMHSWFCPWKNRLYLRDCVFLCRHCVCVHPSHTSTIFAPCFFAITCMAALYSAQAFLWTLLKKVLKSTPEGLTHRHLGLYPAVRIENPTWHGQHVTTRARDDVTDVYWCHLFDILSPFFTSFSVFAQQQVTYNSNTGASE